MQKIIVCFLFFVATLPIKSFSQNCPDITAEVQSCSNYYNEQRAIHEAEYNYAEEECVIDFEMDLDEAIATWEADGEQDQDELDEIVDGLTATLGQCINDSFVIWSDSIMEDADTWNSCLCMNGCDYYCNL